MKSTVCSFFAVLFTILLIASCDSSTSTDGSFDTYRNGTWLVVAENEAFWDGSQSKSKFANTAQSQDDTTLYENPDGKSLQLFYKPEISDDKIFLAYNDSTITETTLDTTNMGYEVTISTPFGPGYGSYGFQPVMGVSFDLPFNCDSTYTDSENIYISNMVDSYEHGDAVDSTVVVGTTQLDVQGIYQTANDFVCQ